MWFSHLHYRGSRSNGGWPTIARVGIRDLHQDLRGLKCMKKAKLRALILAKVEQSLSYRSLTSGSLKVE